MKKFLIVVVSLLIITSCTIIIGGGDNDDPPTRDFNSPEEYISNPSVDDAVEESEIDIHYGSNPPALAGDYSTSGNVTDASEEFSSLIGLRIESDITLYNQTTSGRISLREKVGDLTAWASGGYITGDNGYFTIWQESVQSGSEAGLPDDLTIYVSLLVSGYKDDDGDLSLSGLTIITDAESDNSDYNLEAVIGLWYMYDAVFELDGAASLPKTNNKIKINEFISKMIPEFNS